MKRKVFSVFFCAAALAMFATAAFADDEVGLDPALYQNGLGCGVPGATYWCVSTNDTTTDPNTGLVTLEFIIQTSVAVTPSLTDPDGQTQGITAWNATTGLGWVAATAGPNGTGAVQDLLDFENIGGQDVIFLYCGDTKCSADDLGLPATMPTISDTFTDGKQYIPKSGQVGFGDSYDYQNNVARNGPFTLQNPTTYGIVDKGNLNGSVAEPSSVFLLGSMMIALFALVRKRFSAEA